jgi:regulation of enolase protein 1 (concanavalin A-like superfamily)
MKTFDISTIPAPIEWDLAPVEWTLENDVLSVSAGAQTDLFSNPNGDTPRNNSPRALFVPPAGDFLLSAQVEVDFQGTFDAGVLLVYDNKTSWGKVCFEYSPQGQPMIVSVVNKGTSDDCNSVPIEGNRIYLRIAKIGETFAFHFSHDGQFWHMVRYFTLGKLQNLRAGFSSQAPTGEGCTARFSEIMFSSKTLRDNRSGE